jgi:hypothetical protein
MNRFLLPRCASAIQIVCPLESIAETQLQLQPALLRLSLTLGTVDHSHRGFTHFKLCAHFLNLLRLLFRRRCDGGHQSLRVTPAMEAGITDHVLTLDEVVDLL